MSARPSGYLVVRHDDGFGEVTQLLSNVRYSIGRAPTNQVILKDDLCSRNHAELSFVNGSWYLHDLGSLNGCRHNNQEVKNRDAKLNSLDEIGMGRSRFLFVTDLDDLPEIPSTPSKEKAKTIEGEIEVKHRLRNTRYSTAYRPNLETTVDPENQTISEVNRTQQALASLFRLALEMGTAHNLSELAETVIDSMMESTAAELVAVTAIKEGTRETEMIRHRYRDPDKKTYHKFSQWVGSEVIRTKEAILAENVQNNPTLKNRDSISDLRASSLICAPVLFEDTLLGLLHIYGTAAKHPFSQDDLEFTVAVARQFGIVWKQLQRQDKLAKANQELKVVLKQESELVGASRPLQDIQEKIARVATTNATVLIRGESGSGKELVAREIHFSSTRKDGPYVTLNCAALTETLLESELFGHEKGAFTGATDRMIGKFEAADKGTIFLDEIGEMSLSTQAKFLRVLEGHPFERLGGNNQIRVDVRVVAATNRELEEAVRAGQFRKDLFFRLNVVEMRVPPLRDRPEDVAVLAEHFLKRFIRETGRKLRGFSPDAITKMEQYGWPGNVRELRNIIERAVALSNGPIIDASDIWLSSIDLEPKRGIPFEPITLEELERRHIEKMLEHTNWNKSQTAELLGIERSTLDRKIKAYDLKKE
jgi:transcriptional regulator with GAF, ATPase, and Fis domain